MPLLQNTDALYLSTSLSFILLQPFGSRTHIPFNKLKAHTVWCHCFCNHISRQQPPKLLGPLVTPRPCLASLSLLLFPVSFSLGPSHPTHPSLVGPPCHQGKAVLQTWGFSWLFHRPWGTCWRNSERRQKTKNREATQGI